MASSSSYLPYHEPSITRVLILSSFTLALNAVDAVLDRTLYCGLAGQVLVGAAWGAPGAQWLTRELQDAVAGLGYLGLVLLVFEGGAATDVRRVAQNLGLSAAAAATGVAAPMALSFAVLLAGAGASAVQGFAAGAALASTSLGTTFAVLSASGLAGSRLGCVLGAAAMMDDVAGLVMVQVVSSLGPGAGGVHVDVAAAVVRPVLVSLAFAVGVPLAARFVLRPLVSLVLLGRENENSEAEGARLCWWRLWGFLDEKQTAFVAQTALLMALVAGASFAGASVLLAAYLAGVVVSWWTRSSGVDGGQGSSSSSGNLTSSSPLEEQTSESNGELTVGQSSSRITVRSEEQQQQQQQVSKLDAGTDIYEIYYSQAVNRILKPFFFASIGFSIPISDMFSGDIVWRGIIYGILMAIGKMLCGLWLVRFPVSVSGQVISRFVSSASSRYRTLLSWLSRLRKSRALQPPPKNEEGVGLTTRPGTVAAPRTTENTPARDEGVVSPLQDTPRSNPEPPPPPAKPLSLYPAAIVSCAMVARGEIGFLISAVAESNGVFGRPSRRGDPGAASELFLVVTWAIVLCTVAGPLCVGVLVRRVKNLEGEAARAGDRGTRNVLGVWGV
ncbi:hypothetical protein AAE478_007897 [Parahypoxylon ruwenzoriense]